MTSPLFQRAWAALQKSSRDEATIRQLGRTLTSLRGKSTTIMRQAKQLMVETSGSSERERYSKVSDFVREHIIAEVLRQLGPIGSVFNALIRPNGRSLADQVSDEVQAAMSLLTHFQEVERTSNRPSWLPRRPIAQPMEDGRGGGGSQPPTRTGSSAPQPPRSNSPAGSVSMQVMGRRYQFSEDDPIVTGAMIPVISSNVHSIGYDWNENQPNKGTLKVRFLESKGRKSATRVPGPLYGYFGVHPEVFMAFQQAASKGRFVWDRLRIRGTVTGHRFHYELEDLGDTMVSPGKLGRSTYVPRKATRLGPNEHFLRREFTDQRTGRTHTSQLEDEFVQRIGVNRHGPQGFVPNRGTPNRGTPNRGR